ncbi:MAG: IucA/IucC family siderophore biosynthesis protein [Streptosporangiales bacterium]|nr:IucA/IucC family siderophore biosynthesis protein [Streptosporangiales bacterium]
MHMRNLLTNDDVLYTKEERDARDVLNAVRPDLAGRYDEALSRARTVGLEKLRAALDREGFAESMPPAPPVHPADLVDAVMSARAGSRHPEPWERLRDEVAASAAAHALALVGDADRRRRLVPTATVRAAAGDALGWALSRAADDPGFSPLAAFERVVVDGHPWHPCARMRVGMSVDEVLAYTPEWADEVPLGVVAVRPSEDNGLTALLRRTYPTLDRAPEGYALLPVHPWQLRHVVPVRHARDLAEGRVMVIPGARIPGRPLISVRTFAPRHDRLAPHLKTAMNVQLTSAVRIVSPAAVHNGPRLSRLLDEIADREERFGHRFVVAGELASGHYRPPADEPATSISAASGLGAILRESPERHVAPGELALPLAALGARSPVRDRPLLADALNRIGGPPGTAARRFLAAFCDCALPPLLSLLSRWGVALEAHGQNTVVVLRDGLPVRLVYRDLGGVRVNPLRLARQGLAVPELRGSLCTDSEAELRNKLFGALVPTGLAEVVSALSRVGGVPPSALWRIVAGRVRAAYAPLLDDPAVRERAGRDLAALLGPTVPMKALLRMRLAEDPLEEQWIEVPNPLAGPARGPA